MMTNVGDPAIALLLDNRLVGAASLQVVVADELHVQRFLSFCRVLRVCAQG